jgi:hypothetical protein
LKISPKILKIMDLAGGEGSRPFDQLERGKSIAKGKEAVAGLTEKELEQTKNPQAFLFLQSALYIYFDCFEEAHNIAQDHDGIIGNWLHAILHRREPDAGNSSYWYHRVKIPAKISQGIAQEALKVLGETPPKELEAFQRKMAKSGEWEPEVFVDLCEKARKADSKTATYQALSRIQEVEWSGLVEYILSAD